MIQGVEKIDSGNLVIWIRPSVDSKRGAEKRIALRVGKQRPLIELEEYRVDDRGEPIDGGTLGYLCLSTDEVRWLLEAGAQALDTIDERDW